MFASSVKDFSGLDIVDIKIRLKEEPDYNKRCYLMNPLIRDKLLEETSAKKEAAIIRPASLHMTSWTSYVSVMKERGNVRPAVDLRLLNKINETEKEISVTADEIFRWFGQ